MALEPNASCMAWLPITRAAASTMRTNRRISVLTNGAGLNSKGRIGRP